MGVPLPADINIISDLVCYTTWNVLCAYPIRTNLAQNERHTHHRHVEVAILTRRIHPTRTKAKISHCTLPESPRVIWGNT